MYIIFRCPPSLPASTSSPPPVASSAAGRGCTCHGRGTHGPSACSAHGQPGCLLHPPLHPHILNLLGISLGREWGCWHILSRLAARFQPALWCSSWHHRPHASQLLHAVLPWESPGSHLCEQTNLYAVQFFDRQPFWTFEALTVSSIDWYIGERDEGYYCSSTCNGSISQKREDFWKVWWLGRTYLSDVIHNRFEVLSSFLHFKNNSTIYHFPSISLLFCFIFCISYWFLCVYVYLCFCKIALYSVE